MRFQLKSVSFKQYVQWENFTVPEPNIKNQSYGHGVVFAFIRFRIFKFDFDAQINRNES